MDFYTIKERYPRRDTIEIYPDFQVRKSKDLMVRGHSFYAIWDEKAGIWSTDEYDVRRLVDEELTKYREEHADHLHGNVTIKYMSSFSSGSWKEFKRFLLLVSDNYKQLDTKITFSNTETKRTDYASMRLPYAISKMKIPAYDELMSTLYSPNERKKIEWAIGSIIAGDSKTIQKFLVFYGDPGTGKSTVLDIIDNMFEGYSTIFEAKELVGSNNAFATEAFSSNPLIAIQHDGDLSRIEDNSKLNSIISHEEVRINEKHKSSYKMKINCMLFMGTNKAVKITDGKAGIIRRLIDINPTGNKIPPDRYLELVDAIKFEYGGIAQHCLDVYKEMGKTYYNKYRPVGMMFKTNPFYNFVEAYYDEFERDDSTTLKQAFAMYKKYCEEANMDNRIPLFGFREELKNYFKDFTERIQIDGVQMRSYYSGFLKEKFHNDFEEFKPVKKKNWIDISIQPSILDEELMDCPAQYASAKETPLNKWEDIDSTLSSIDTTKLHYVQVPENHIVIDFDIKGDNGEKSLDLNLEAAKEFPKTYCETSKSGNGIHLHYIYDGDVSKLSRVYDDNIEVKVFTGNSSLRRKLVKCNDIPIATINSGLPLKELKGDKMVNFEGIKSEKLLRVMIKKNLNKEYHAFTKPSMDFIKKLTDDAYNSGLHYDISDMRQAILIFAAESHNQADACMKIAGEIHYKSDEPSDNVENGEDVPIIFYDVEVFPNLFLINWKKEGEGNPIVRMINPTANEVEELCKFKLVGFNCRRYDNHILYARMMKYTNQQLYNLSQKIISSDDKANSPLFGEAYNISYTDIYDYSAKKQSLKKWEIELGIHHQELGLPWDEPVPEELWPKVAEYCDNDVIATEAVWNATKADFRAREILVEICKRKGISASVNNTTNSLTAKIVFGNERHPQLAYTDLATGEYFE